MAAWCMFFLLLLQCDRAWGLRTQISCHPHSPEAADGSCTVSTWMSPWAGRTDCTFAKAVYPKTEQELVQAVADAVRHGTKLKVSGALHSTPKLVCPGSPAGTLISTEHYDASFNLDREAQTVTLGAGLKISDLVDKLADAGFGLPNIPAWSGLSVAGAMSTGAHGSSLSPHAAPLHDHVLSLRIVVPASPDLGYATVLDVREGDVLAAARLSLGVLGAISQITLRVEPASKRRLAFEVTGDEDLADRIVSHPVHSQFGDVRWYPAQRRAVFRHDNTVPLDTPGDGAHLEPAVLPGPREQWQAGPALQEEARATGNRTLLCEQAREQAEELWGPLGYGVPVVGHSRHIQTGSQCLHPLPGTGHICFFHEPSLTLYESSANVPVSRIRALVKDVERLREQRREAFCGLELLLAIFFRYIKGGSAALLGGTEDAVAVTFLFHRTADERTPGLDLDVMQELEQLALVKHGGKHHWGKSNRFVSFQGTAGKFGERLERFLRVKERLDPDGIFSSPWSDAVLGIEGGTPLNQLKPFCALEGLCVCEKDEHCHPEAGYLCRPGLVFHEARVCRFVDRDAQVLKDEL